MSASDLLHRSCEQFVVTREFLHRSGNTSHSLVNTLANPFEKQGQASGTEVALCTGGGAMSAADYLFLASLTLPLVALLVGIVLLLTSSGSKAY